MSFRQIDPEKLINRLGMNVPLEVYENLIVLRKENTREIGVRVAHNFFVSHRADAKKVINDIRSKARELGLNARYNPKGTWLVISP